MSISVSMKPTKSALGIGQVVSAYQRFLPEYGVEFTEDEDQADLVVVHAGEHTKRAPHIHHCHGLYPTATLDKSESYFRMNADVIENARTARQIVVPSEWVAQLFRRDMLVNPIVMPHGIDPDVWPFSRNGHDGYVLWAKGHNPGVCDPSTLNALAEAVPGQNFVTTFGAEQHNIKQTGRLPFEQMKQTLSQAEIYLAVTKETFGIQTLEAMACGVPILGYDWGGTGDIVTHGHDGYLVEPGDIDGLVKGLVWLKAHRAVVGANAIETSKQYAWPAIAEQLADIYAQVLNDNLLDGRTNVSVIIPCYNYGDRVGKAIESVLAQDYDGIEIVVVNDGSTDDTATILDGYKDVVTIVDQPNSGVAAARNNGVQYSSGEYVACLDADDEYLPNFISTLLPALDADPGLGIAYSKLVMVDDTGRTRVSGWPPDFCYKRQALGHNQVPSACLMRRSAWERAGGYKPQYTPAEDAELWLRITSVGFDAVRVTDEPLYRYSVHEGSLSRSMPNVKYEEDKPWAVNALFGAPACDYEFDSYPVRNYDDTWVSVIIPVGPGHEDIAWRAVDSVFLQSMPYWEVVVVNDSGAELVNPNTGLSLQDTYPFVIQEAVDYRNVSKSRNRGVELAASDLLVFLDADDALDKDYLLASIQAYNDNPDKYIYTDWLSWDGSGEKRGGRKFSCEGLLLQTLHPVTAMVPRSWHQEVGGFDEDLGVKGWEDWDYWLKMVLVGRHEGYRVDQPLVKYDISTGSRREDSLVDKDKLLPIITGRYSEDMCRNCGRSKSRPGASRPAPAPAKPVIAPARPAAASGPFSRPRGKLMTSATSDNQSANMVKVVENSGNRGKHQVVGVVTGTKYGKKRHGQRFDMDVRDQQMQPHLYVIAGAAQVQPVAPTMPERPVPPTSVRRPSPPPVAQPQRSPEDELETYSAEDDGIDLALLKVSQIKALGLEGEDAAIAYEQEFEGKQRKTVLEYLEAQAGDWLEPIDEE